MIFSSKAHPQRCLQLSFFGFLREIIVVLHNIPLSFTLSNALCRSRFNRSFMPSHGRLLCFPQLAIHKIHRQEGYLLVSAKHTENKNLSDSLKKICRKKLASLWPRTTAFFTLVSIIWSNGSCRCLQNCCYFLGFPEMIIVLHNPSLSLSLSLSSFSYLSHGQECFAPQSCNSSFLMMFLTVVYFRLC